MALLSRLLLAWGRLVLAHRRPVFMIPVCYAPLGRIVNNGNTAYWGVQENEQRFMQQFGANLRRERTARGITQQKLSELADLNIRTVQKIEAGKINIRITTAARLQEGLGCPWENLAECSANRTPSQNCGQGRESGREFA